MTASDPFVKTPAKGQKFNTIYEYQWSDYFVHKYYFNNYIM